MGVTTEWYQQDPIIIVTGGADFDWRLTLDEVQTTTVDGRVTAIHRIGPYNFTGWGSFRGVMATFDGEREELVSVTLDGPAIDGTLAIRGSRFMTWRAQEAGTRSGRLTVLGAAPGGGDFTVCPMRFVLQPGSTPPTAPTVPDWSVLR